MLIGRRRDNNRAGSGIARIAFLLVISVWLSLNARAAEPLKGVALVIGQSAYQQLEPLPNPERDARQIEDLLARLGFETTLATDGNTRKLRRAVDAFIEDSEGADVALVYYSGHGIDAGGTNYLIPVDAGVTSLAEANTSLISAQDILDRLRQRAKITILLLDACRSNPFPKDALVKADANSAGIPISTAGLGASRGFIILDEAASSDSIGEVIGFAAEPGKPALDGAAGGNSPYAAALLKHLSANAGYDFGQVMTMVTEEVYLATGTRQRPWMNASLRRFLSFGGKVDEASADEVLLKGERRKLLLSIAATPQDMRAAVEEMAKDQSLPLDPLYGMLKELQVDLSAGPEELDKQLRAGAENLKKILAEKAAPLRKDPELIRLAGLADRAQAEGAIALAKDYRAKASARADKLDKTLDQREAEVLADRVELASTYADEADTAILAFDYELAAAKYAKAYEQVAGRDAALAARYQLGEARTLYSHGEYKGSNEALKRSIDLYQAVLESTTRSNRPDDWAAVQIDLGIALQTLGKREGGTENLIKAIATFELALTEWTRERAPLNWARIQDNLGNALQILSEHESGTESLTRAVAAYEAALSEQTRERVPFNWARTQNNLGNALRILGERENGTENLNKAIAAFEAALGEWTRERAPLDWATVQSNLGVALSILGERESDKDILARAVAAYEAALSEWTRERVPLDWAMTQTNLGNTLQALSEHESGTESLTKAVAAYEAALSEQTRERVPLDWAMTQNNLGNALRGLGERESGTEALVKAVTAFEAALGERKRERVPLDWAVTQHNLGSALLILGIRNKESSTIESGRQSLQNAWNVYKSVGNTQHDRYFQRRLQEFDDALTALAK